MKTRIIVFLTIVGLVAGFGGACKKRKGEVGSAENPLRFYFMPLKEEAVVKKNEAIIINYLEKTTGLKIEAINAKDFVTIVKAFGQKKADIAFMNTLGYLLARDWAKVEAHLLTIYGDIYTDYRGELLAKADGEVQTVGDINDKVVIFADPYSASGYLYPLKYFQDNNIKPKKTKFAQGHKDAIEKLYLGEADVAAVYHTRPTAEGVERDARAELLPKYPDIMTKLKIIGLTDVIPNGPVALRNDLPEEIKAKLVGALVQFVRTAEGRKVLYDLYNVTGLTLTTDANYDGVQKVIKELGKTIEDVVPGSVSFYRTYIDTIPAQ
jgi:phosphonate transport system substrate-binding protein